jgi:hypothetical protein
LKINPPITFTIRKTTGAQEWVARFHKDGVFMPGWTVYETDKQAAEDSAKATIAAYHRMSRSLADRIADGDPAPADVEPVNEEPIIQQLQAALLKCHRYFTVMREAGIIAGEPWHADIAALVGRGPGAGR